MLIKKFNECLLKMGMKGIQYPLFYNAPIGIRFEIQSEGPIWLNVSFDEKDNYVLNEKYLKNTFKNAKAIYDSLPHKPNILRIDVCPDILKEYPDFSHLQLGSPHEQINSFKIYKEDNEKYLQKQLYWNLSLINFNYELLLKEIIRADFGGLDWLVYSVFFMNTKDLTMLHFYDDCGGDLIASDKEILRPIYKKCNHLILDYDREKIDKLFATK